MRIWADRVLESDLDGLRGREGIWNLFSFLKWILNILFKIGIKNRQSTFITIFVHLIRIPTENPTIKTISIGISFQSYIFNILNKWPAVHFPWKIIPFNPKKIYLLALWANRILIFHKHLHIFYRKMVWYFNFCAPVLPTDPTINFHRLFQAGALILVFVLYFFFHVYYLMCGPDPL